MLVYGIFKSCCTPSFVDIYKLQNHVPGVVLELIHAFDLCGDPDDVTRDRVVDVQHLAYFIVDNLSCKHVHVHWALNKKKPRNRMLVNEITSKSNHGFFSCVFGILAEARDAEIRGEFVDVVWGPENAYWESGNAWHDFFEPIMRIPESMPERVKRAPQAGWGGVQAYPGMSVLDTMSVLASKYIRVAPEVLVEVLKYDITPETVGVHFRGTDKMAIGQAEFCGPPVEEVIAHVRENVSSKRIFLATDCAHALAKFKSELHDFTVLTTECLRSHSAISIHNHYGRDKGQLTSSGIRKGREVLVDAILLSKCAHLIRSPSGVSLWSLVLNPRQTFTDLGKMKYGYTWESFMYETERDHTPVVKDSLVVVPYVGANQSSFSEYGDLAGMVEFFTTHAIPDERMVWVGKDPPSTEQRRAIDEFYKTSENAFALMALPYHEMFPIVGKWADNEITFISKLLQAFNIVAPVELIKTKMVLQCYDDRLRVVCTGKLWNTVWPVVGALVRGEVKVGGTVMSVETDTLSRYVMLICSICMQKIGHLSK